MPIVNFEESRKEIMKVVLFCGGKGTRLREYGDNIPKPLVPIGYRPVLWHVMKYYAHFGHKDFILCLGYMADKIKDYFLHYHECISNDFVLSGGGKDVALITSDIQDWKITFVDTGLHSNIGQRLRMVRHLVRDEEMFLANYTDGLTDLQLPLMVDKFERSGKVATFICAPPSQSFHVVKLKNGGKVASIQSVRDSGMLVNGGFFVFRKEIFEFMRDGEELIGRPFDRLIAKNLVLGYQYDRFWSMDTFKEQQELSDMCTRGDAPWEVWKSQKAQSH
jgi:glucose-1-phosphate cytidylyltransferase